ncbi:MAG: hypothetical protein KJ600_03365, partial [Nanoarchaeota archaeon]|nr:hypothetical protein [Nanoarchaeota archaeon]
MELKNLILQKKGAFFSVDALIALIIIFFVILVSYPVSNYLQPDPDIHSDILKVLSTLKVSEVDSDYVRSLIANGKIRDPNKNLLEQIGEFYILNITIARLLAEDVLGGIETTENFGLWYGKDDLIFSKNNTPFESARDVDVARQVITGIVAGKNITGFAARAFLSSNVTTSYFYFGGYVGDGDISARIDYEGNITPVGKMELVINNDFDMYVNNNLVGSFAASPSETEPANYTFSTANFSSGENTVEFRGENLYIAGGFIKVSYSGVAIDEQKRYRFPGIDGLVNLYDGFYVPNSLTGMDISLHLDTNYTTFLNIGNVTVYEGSTDGVETLNFDNDFLKELFGGSYDSLEGRTIPLRLGTPNASYTEGISQRIDVFSVTDLSGSMLCSEVGYYGSHQCHESSHWCGKCGGVWMGPINSAKEANNLFIDFILNNSGNEVGLVGYSTSAADEDYHPLSGDNDSLKAIVEGWDAYGWTCICCGINRAAHSFPGTVLPNENNGRLIVYYDFDSSFGGAVISDESGLGNDGAINGNVVSVVGLEENAAEFDGSGDFIGLPDIIDTTQGSVSVWIKADNWGQQTIFDATVGDPWTGDSPGSNNKRFAMVIDYRGFIQFMIEDTSDVDYLTEQDVSGLSPGEWHHVVGVWRFGGNAPSVELYFDGNLVDSDDRPAGNMPNFNSPRLGDTTHSSGGPYFDGLIDDFRIYTKPLSLEEVQGLNDITPNCDNAVTEVGEVCDRDAQLCESGGQAGSLNCQNIDSPGFCDGFLDCDLDGECGDGVLNDGEECDDGNLEDFDGCNDECEVETRHRSMVVMSDGQATSTCDEQDTGDATQDAIQASIDACEDYGIIVHAIGFGDGVDDITLKAIADNGCNGSYYYSDVDNLSTVYEQIASDIITEYVEQTLVSYGGAAPSRLFPDSYIDFIYEEEELPYGLIITAEKNFIDAFSGSFVVPPESTSLGAHIVSYSGPSWTSKARANENVIFDLSSYGVDYR